MTTQEFSDEFDVLVASYRRFKDFDNKEILDSIEFNEYEKSIFLTMAQEQIVLSYYNGANAQYLSFEKTEENRRYLGSLVKTEDFDLTGNSPYTVDLSTATSKVWFITREKAITQKNSTNECISEKELEVVPITQEAYYKTINNPFRSYNNRRVLRFDFSEGKITLLSKYPLSKYSINYLTKPNPIILTALNGLTINGKSDEAGCELHEALHRHILELAVQLALSSKNIKIEKE